MFKKSVVLEVDMIIKDGKGEGTGNDHVQLARGGKKALYKLRGFLRGKKRGEGDYLWPQEETSSSMD